MFSFDSLHHMQDCPTAVAEMLRVCKPGGVVAIANLNERGAAAVAGVISRRGESHFRNGCVADTVASLASDQRVVDNASQRPYDFDSSPHDDLLSICRCLRAWPALEAVLRDQTR